MTPAQIEALDWDKGDGLLPAIVQDARSGKVLMLGYMNAQALGVTLDSKRVTFFSRSKNRLWTKGETSGNHLALVAVTADCDNDSLLVTANPEGPTCHTGSESCFGNDVIPQGSYTARLWAQGPTRIAQKVGEEGVEVALAAVTQSDDRLVGESADLLFHLALLLKSRNLSLEDAVTELAQRHAAKR
jgi:phosphoribosyl-ATP pyrophosphohydrolase/phosphoribosyl-AMP cyclohydrolase